VSDMGLNSAYNIYQSNSSSCFLIISCHLTLSVQYKIKKNNKVKNNNSRVLSEFCFDNKYLLEEYDCNVKCFFCKHRDLAYL